MAKNTNNGALGSNGARKRLHAVIDGKRVPLTRTVALYIAQQTHLLAVGDPQRTEMIAEAELAANNGSSVSSASTVV